MPRQSIKGRKVKKWKASSPTIRKSILAFLLQDHYMPRGFNELRRYMSERKICSGITLSIYLKELEKDHVVMKVKAGKLEKYVVCPTRKYRTLSRKSMKAEKKFYSDMRLLRKETDKMIKDTERLTLYKEEVDKLVEDELVSFERLEFQIFDMFLKSGIPVEEFLSSKLWHIFVTTTFDLEVQLISAFHKKYPEQTVKVLEKFRTKPEG